jgi:hypothetical protein
MVMECTQYQRPTMWSLVGDSRVLEATGGWRVLPTASGARLVARVEMELHGPLKLAAPLLRRVVKQRVRQRGYQVFAVNPTRTRSKATPAITTCSPSPAASTG